jgi:predicted HAD superfamily Cof-like phosphohydrolase
MDEVKRICTWNAKRYEQEFNKELAMNLLREELLEFYHAKEEVDELDALLDLVYVAFGAMWKMGLSSEQIIEALKVVCNSNESKSEEKVASHVKANIDKGAGFIRPEPVLQEILDRRETND